MQRPLWRWTDERPLPQVVAGTAGGSHHPSPSQEDGRLPPTHSSLGGVDHALFAAGSGAAIVFVARLSCEVSWLAPGAGNPSA